MSDRMVELRDFRPEVTPETPQCPGAMIDKHVRNAAIEFCIYTRAWRVALQPIRTKDGVAEYRLLVPGCALIEDVRFAQHNDQKIEPTSEEWKDTTDTNWRSVESDQATHYYLPDRETIRLYPIPDETVAKALDVVVSLKPRRDADALPGILYDDHAEAIAHGALVRLKAMPNKPWTDLNSVAYHASEFKRMKAEEKTARNNDFTRGGTAQFLPFNYYG